MAKKIKLQKYTWLIIAAMVVLAVVVLSSGEGGALAKFSAARQQIQPAPTAITYQGVLNILNKCYNAGIVFDGTYMTCDDYCKNSQGATCIAAEQIYPKTSEGDFYYVKRDCSSQFVFPTPPSYSTDIMCTCCRP